MSTWGYIPFNLKKGVAANITHEASMEKIKEVIWLGFKIKISLYRFFYFIMYYKKIKVKGI